MFTFKNENGISLYRDNTPVITDIKPWVNTRLRPWENLKCEDYLPLFLKEMSDSSLTFVSENGSTLLSLYIKEEKNTFALFMNGSYNAKGTLGHGAHVNEFKGFGFSFDMPHVNNYIDSFMNCQFWQKNLISDSFDKIRNRTQFLTVQNSDGNMTMLTTVCDKDYKSDISYERDSLTLTVHSNKLKDDIDDCVLLCSFGDDPYKLSYMNSAFGLKVMNKKQGKLRKSKKYPEIFEYLGWCSWDAFHMDVTDKDLYNKVKEFSDKNIPVKWIIIDDMWGDVDCIDLPSMHSRELNSWEADPIRFPNGLKGAVDDIKRDFDIKVGIWHPTSGYWAGINPLGKLAKEHPDLLEFVVPRADGNTPVLVHSFEKNKVKKYYDIQHQYYKDCGIDFTKVDNQGGTERFSYNQGTIGECAKNLHSAIEHAAKKHYNGDLINCMGMPNENYWNRTYSNINRVSGDFQPENRKWFIQHLLQCSFNSLTQGALFTGDWDMWWSDDAQAKKNAVLRAMSGGPIYMSDELNRSVKDIIMPTVFSDGRIIRLSDPALPSADCLFEDSEHNGKIFKVFNKAGDHGVIAAFNLSENESKVKGYISPCDVHNIKRGKYCIYDWFGGSVKVLNRKERMPLSLNDYDDFRLYIVCPVKEGKAVIGLKEKYMSAAAVKIDGSAVTALDNGTLLIYSESNIEGFKKESENLYSMSVSKGQIVKI